MEYEDLLNKIPLFDYRQLVMAKNRVNNKKLMDHRMVMVLDVIAKIL
jgi:hypothetical protein